MQYYYNLYIIQISNQNKDVSKYKPKIIKVKIQPPAAKSKKVKLFNLGE